MNTSQVLIAYEKEVNTRSHAKLPNKVVRGNVILLVPNKTINFFNIPTYSDTELITQEVKGYSRTIGKSKVMVSGHSRLKRGQEQGRTVRLNPKQKPKRVSFVIKFPYFFNLTMIRESLMLLLRKNLSQCQFQVLPSQKKRDIYEGNPGVVWMPPKPVETRNIDLTHWGEICLVKT